MSSKDDLDLAKALQAEYDSEAAQKLDTEDDILFDSASLFSTSPVGNKALRCSGTESMSIVDQRWELLDPSPDARAMFMEFNDRYFWGRLAGVEVRWSPRMTLCAGLCCYEGHGGLCSIRLSSPLLKLRPRKDLVETLLHEMIHAYLFVTDNNKDHDGHGPEFCKHMKRLNTETGTNITIYHTFHDEVDNYRQHWWKCNGPCQKAPPYFGLVKRAMNRAPAPRDPWWGEHQRKCGGTYTKIKEPEGYGEKKKGSKRKKEEGSGSADEKDAKRPATGNNKTPATFTGKGNVLGTASSSKPTLLQKWISEQQKKQDAASANITSKSKPPSSLGAPPRPSSTKSKPPSSVAGAPHTNTTRPPSSLGAPRPSSTTPTPPSTVGAPHPPTSKSPTDVPSNHKSPPLRTSPKTSSTNFNNDKNSSSNGNATRTGKDGKPGDTPLKKWVSQNADALRKAVFASGAVDTRKRNHTRKLSGKRKELLAIFESDSDSDDELFKPKPRPKHTGIGSVKPSPSFQNSRDTFINPSPAPNRKQVSPTQDNRFNHGTSHISSTKPPLFGNSATTFSPYIKPDASKTNTSDRPGVLLSTNPSTSSQKLPIFRNPSKTFTPYIKQDTSKASTSNNYGVPLPSSASSSTTKSRSEVNSFHKPSLTNHISGLIGGENQRSNTSTTLSDNRPSHGTQQNSPVSVSDQSPPFIKQVQCPVCTMRVAELDINAHLDMCLGGM